MATVSMSMATKSSDLDDQKTEVIIQTKGYTLTPPSGQHSPEETEAFGSTTEDGGATPPPPHTWQVPVMEDMV